MKTLLFILLALTANAQSFHGTWSAKATKDSANFTVERECTEIGLLINPTFMDSTKTMNDFLKINRTRFLWLYCWGSCLPQSNHIPFDWCKFVEVRIMDRGKITDMTFNEFYFKILTLK